MTTAKVRKVKRRVEYGGLTYYARTEALKRDGGDPPGQWYWVVEDPKCGACIDERVPQGYFGTLARARDYLAEFLGCKPEDFR